MTAAATTNILSPNSVSGQTAPLGGGPTLPPELQKAMSKLTEISSLPEIVTHIVQVVEDPKATAHDMHEIVKNDPALASKILKVVNSAFYGLPAQIGSLDRAIVMLGMSAVKNIALATSLSRFFRPEGVTGRFAARDLWTHCSAVGVCAKLLSKAGGSPHSEEAFVAGLVHDMGLLIELQLFPEQLKLVVERCEKSPADFCAVEAEIIGADHQTFGAALAAKWKFPPSLRNAITYHHAPTQVRTDQARMVMAIYLADTICCQNQFGFYLTAQHQGVDNDMLASIGVSESKVNEIMEVLPEHVAEAEKIFAD